MLVKHENKDDKQQWECHLLYSLAVKFADSTSASLFQSMIWSPVRILESLHTAPEKVSSMESAMPSSFPVSLVTG